jgi:hypothetical protein
METYENYQSLSVKETELLVEKLFSEITDDDEIVETLLHLSLFTNGESLKKIYPKLVEKEFFYPSEIFMHADAQIAEKLIDMVEKDKYNTNHLLCCLAWIGTQNVIDFFIRSSEEKPEWTKKLYVLPKKYAEQAGWTFDSDNSKRILINTKVTGLVNKKDANKSKEEFPTFKNRQDSCPFCKNQLTTFLELDTNKNKVEYSTCMMCSCYEPLFMGIDNKGKSFWHEKNKKWEHLDETGLEMEPIEENILVISNEQRKPEFSISQFVEIGKSQIGGYPTWIQDADYLKCPDCENTMNFIGQIDMEDVEDYGEGIYYLHYCEKCKITGTNYQQT